VTVAGGDAINEESHIDWSIFDTYRLRYPFRQLRYPVPKQLRHVQVQGNRSILLRDIVPDYFNLEKLWDLGTESDNSPLYVLVLSVLASNP
jgi:hypothetical protein